MNYYIASCVFTSQFPVLSHRIQRYVSDRFSMPAVRCCVPKYKIREFTEKIPAGEEREAWKSLPDSAPFIPGDVVYSLCHNCSNIVGEMHPEVEVHSLWELIAGDEKFFFPDYAGLEATVQDCWRSRERRQEQDAIRALLDRMHISWREAAENHENTDFCGMSLYRPQPPRNPRLAPKHYVEKAVGKFNPLPQEEQEKLMRDYCARFETKSVICYCHYCLEGLRAGGVDGRHIAELLFPPENPV